MIDIVQLPLYDSMSQIDHLFKAHFEEVYGTSNPFPPDPWIEQYDAIEKLGMAFGLFVVDDEEIVGYSLNFVQPNLHSRGFTSCVNDVLYIRPESRIGTTAVRLIKATVEKAKDKNASLMTWSSPVGSPLGKVLERMGYRPKETIYFKEI